MGYYIANFTPFKFLITLISCFFVFFLATAFYVYFDVSYGLPSLEQLENPQQDNATQVFSADGELLDHFYKQKRVSLPYDSIPKDFFNALIATEDRQFYHHWGVHSARIIKAFIKDLMAFRTKEGGSTITMQLARNLYFSHANTLNRKLKEAFTAIQIEKTYTKNEIIAMYANTVPFGRGAYGVQVAAQVYFDKSPMELTTSECAYLVGLLKAPERYNGIVDYDRALDRRNLVLTLMKEQDYLTDSQFDKAVEEPINLAKGSRDKKGASFIAPHFVEMVRQQISKDMLMKDYDLYRDGLVIYTTLNSKIQEYAKEAVEEHLKEFQKTFTRSWSWNQNKNLLDDLTMKAIKNNVEYVAAPAEKKSSVENALRRNHKFIDSVKNAATTVQCGVVVMDQSTGEIIAMVGASPKFMAENNDAKYSLNHITQIHRQAGSSFKPILYTSALQQGLTPTTMIDAGPYTYRLPGGETWSPRGSALGNDSAGQVTLAEGLARSINTVAARLITQYTTPQNVIDLAHKLGVQSALQPVPALALGAGGEVSPFEMVNAYATLANEGIRLNPYSVKRIEDQYGNVLFEKKKNTTMYDAVSPKYAHEITTMMEGVVNHGTAYEVRKFLKGVDAAGKTGTTNDYADAWFIGYTPQLVAGVWVGFDDRRVTFTGGYGYGAKAAVPIWGRLMAKIYADEKLPYKQKQFSFAISDSLSKDSTLKKQAMNNLNNINKRNLLLPLNKSLALQKKGSLPPEAADEKKKFNFPKLNQALNK